MALYHLSRLGLEYKFLENKSCGQAEFFAFDKFTFQNLAVCKPTFYTFYTSHLRWNSTIYHEDLGQNAVFHNFSRQIALNIQEDQLWAFSETVENISKITYTASQYSLLTNAKLAVTINRVTLQHNREFVIFDFLFNGFITMCNLKKRLIRLKTNDIAIKWQGRLLTINERKIIRWNIYRDSNFLSLLQVLKCF